MKKYFQYLKESLIGKITLGLIVFIIALSILLFFKASTYLSTKLMIIGILSLVVMIGLLWLCHYKAPKVSIVLETLVAVALIFGCISIQKVDDFSETVTETKQYESVQIVALKESKISKNDSFQKYKLAYAQDDSQAYVRSSDILKDNNKKVKEACPYENTQNAYKDFKEGKVELLVLTNMTKSDLDFLCTQELDYINENYQSEIEVILSKEYPIEEAKAKEVDISKDPFTVYFQGADLSSGQNINSTGRGDVNILLTVNPQTKKVNLQVIPRDLFVYIPCKNARSKLSYSGWWGGVQSSIASIEKELGVEINYYAKINFDGLTELVDALGGVEVYSHYTYTAGEYSYKKGYNKVDGKKALVFARARKMLPLNERSRGYQQMELIKGIFKKFAKEPTYDHAMSVLDSLEDNFTTNLPKEDFMKAYELVVDLLPELQTMENHSIEGKYQWHTDEVRTNYYQYYFYPSNGELEAVKERIDNVLNGR